MSRFSNELKVIPRAAWIVAAMIPVVGMGGLFAAAFFSAGHTAAHALVLSPFVLLGCIPLAIFALLIGYVYGDAKRRGMRYVMWTLLAILIPDAIGIILYFVLRDPLPNPCPTCKTPVKRGFTFCPNCGTAVQPTCPSCGKGVEYGWMNCPHCGNKLPSQAPSAPQAA